MKIKELKEKIKDLPDDMEVILQRDAEGNGHSPVADADADLIYIAESTWSGYIIDPYWTAEDACMDEREWEEVKKEPRALVLAPVN